MNELYYSACSVIFKKDHNENVYMESMKPLVTDTSVLTYNAIIAMSKHLRLARITIDIFVYPMYYKHIAKCLRRKMTHGILVRMIMKESDYCTSRSFVEEVQKSNIKIKWIADESAPPSPFIVIDGRPSNGRVPPLRTMPFVLLSRLPSTDSLKKHVCATKIYDKQLALEYGEMFSTAWAGLQEEPTGTDIGCF